MADFEEDLVDSMRSVSTNLDIIGRTLSAPSVDDRPNVAELVFEVNQTLKSIDVSLRDVARALCDWREISQTR